MNFGLSLYTKKNQLLSCLKGVMVQGETTAKPIVVRSGLSRLIGGVTRSKGTCQERINFLDSENKSYHLAIQILTPEEQKQIEKQGHAGWSWLRCFYWKPVKISDGQGHSILILMNIQSAVKRLQLLGLTEKEVKGLLDQEGLKGDFIKAIQDKVEEKSQKEIENQIREEFSQSFGNDFSGLSDYRHFKNAVEVSFQDKEEANHFLLLFNEVKAIMQKNHSSFKEAIQFVRQKIGHQIDLFGYSFAEACEKYKKKYQKENS